MPTHLALKVLALILLTPLITTVYAQDINLEFIDGDLPPTQIPTPGKESAPTQAPIPLKIQKEDFLSDTTSINLNNNLIDFGALNPTNPIIRYTSIRLNSPSNYQLIAYFDSFLKANDNNYFIPNTSCDSGACSTITPGLWASTLTYGLGIQCSEASSSVKCLNSSSKKDFYQTLPVGQTNAPVAVGAGESEIKLTYKINTAPTQQPGTYTNTITLILVPSL